jgi:hypothetical protein
MTLQATVKLSLQTLMRPYQGITCPEFINSCSHCMNIGFYIHYRGICILAPSVLAYNIDG